MARSFETRAFTGLATQFELTTIPSTVPLEKLVKLLDQMHDRMQAVIDAQGMHIPY